MTNVLSTVEILPQHCSNIATVLCKYLLSTVNANLVAKKSSDDEFYTKKRAHHTDMRGVYTDTTDCYTATREKGGSLSEQN